MPGGKTICRETQDEGSAQRQEGLRNFFHRTRPDFHAHSMEATTNLVLHSSRGLIYLHITEGACVWFVGRQAAWWCRASDAWMTDLKNIDSNLAEESKKNKALFAASASDTRMAALPTHAMVDIQQTFPSEHITAASVGPSF